MINRHYGHVIRMILGFTICVCPLTGAAIARQSGVPERSSSAGPPSPEPLAEAKTPQRSDSGERERLLLERIERLEKRLAELESRMDGKNRPDPPIRGVNAAAQPIEKAAPQTGDRSPATPIPFSAVADSAISVSAVPVSTVPVSIAPVASPLISTSPSVSITPVASRDDQGLLDFIRGTTFNLTLDGYYGYNFNKPVGGINLLRAFDVLSNSFSLNQATMVIERAPDVATGRRFGVRVDLQYGQATETLQGSAANEPRPQAYRPIFQAYGTYIAPIGTGLTIDFGKWASALGFENNYTKDQINYSRSYFFDFLPFYHFGFRGGYNVTDKLNLTYWLVNGAQQSEDFNGFKSQAVLLNIKPASSISWNINYYTGIEGRAVVPLLNPGIPTLPTQPGLSTQVITPAPRGREHIFDSYIGWAATSKLTIAAEGDYVVNRLQTFSAPAHVIGGALYGRYQFTPRIALGWRAEYLSDRGGLFSGVTQALKETTLTAEYKLAEGFLARGEWRRDFSNQPFFLTQASGVLSKQQNTATLGLVWWFGRKVGSW